MTSEQGYSVGAQKTYSFAGGVDAGISSRKVISRELVVNLADGVQPDQLSAEDLQHILCGF